MRRVLHALVVWAILSLNFGLQAAAGAKPIAWQGWSEDLFSKAKSEHRLVLLDLEAVWCHWCHVMELQTYSNPEVQKLVGEKFIAVKIDQDSRPDLANRYQDYGWPATILFDENGREISKNRGFLTSQEMTKILNLATENPRALKEPRIETKAQFSNQGILSDALRQELQSRHENAYDLGQEGLKLKMKFLDADSVEWSMVLGLEGNTEQESRARRYLNQARSLLDPVWGGVYQYSTGGEWTHPHFEKVMAFQAKNLRMYSLAYAIYQDPNYLNMAQSIAGFLERFMRSPEGAFYISMDADLKPGEHGESFFSLDDAGRRAAGQSQEATGKFS